MLGAGGRPLITLATPSKKACLSRVPMLNLGDAQRKRLRNCLLRKAGAAVDHERDIHFFVDRRQAVQVDLGLPARQDMHVADRHGESVDPGLADIAPGFLRIGLAALVTIGLSGTIR